MVEKCYQERIKLLWMLQFLSLIIKTNIRAFFFLVFNKTRSNQNAKTKIQLREQNILNRKSSTDAT